MRKLTVVLLAALLASWPVLAETPGFILEPGAYVLDQPPATLKARLRLLGLRRNTTYFTGLSGGFTYDPDRPEASHVVITVDPRSISGGNPVVRRRMLGLLEPDRFPVITFESRRLWQADERQALTGDLTLHGVTRPLVLQMTFRAEVSADGETPRKAVFSGAGRIRRSDFGIIAMRGVVGDQIDLVFEVGFTKR